MDKPQQTARVAAIRQYLDGIGHPVSSVQAHEVLARALGLKNKHLLARTQESRSHGEPTPAGKLERSAATHRLTPAAELPLSVPRLRELDWQVDLVLAVPADLLGHTEALNDHVSEKITGNEVALEDIDYEHLPALDAGQDHVALRVRGVIGSPTDWFPEEAERAERQFYEDLGLLARKLRVAASVHLVEGGFMSRWTVQQVDRQALATLREYAHRRGATNDTVNRVGDEVTVRLTGQGPQAADTREFRLTDLKYAELQGPNTWHLSIRNQPLTLMLDD